MPQSEKEEAADQCRSGSDSASLLGLGRRGRKEKSEFLQRVSVTIARGNSRVLDSMRHDWQLASTPQPDLVTSTVHDPRTPAATSDLDAHDRMAATPAGGY